MAQNCQYGPSTGHLLWGDSDFGGLGYRSQAGWWVHYYQSHQCPDMQRRCGVVLSCVVCVAALLWGLGLEQVSFRMVSCNLGTGDSCEMNRTVAKVYVKQSGAHQDLGNWPSHCLCSGTYSTHTAPESVMYSTGSCPRCYWCKAELDPPPVADSWPILTVWHNKHVLHSRTGLFNY